MSKTKKMLTNMRIVVLIIFLLLSLFAINPKPDNEGVTIRSVIKDSAANLAKIPTPDSKSPPISKEKIISINNVPINNEQDYFQFTENLLPNQTITIRTNKGIYPLTTIPSYENATAGIEDIGIRVFDAPTSNIRKGLDLQGGTRVLLVPKEELSAQDTASLIDSMKQRLNIYGLSDLVIREVSDRPGIIGEGQDYIMVEIAGATQEEVKDLLANQGKFEARISNKTVFLGGDDIKAVCRSADCAGIDPFQRCNPIQGGVACRFRFSITLSPEAARRQADATENLEIVYENDDEYLNESLELYLDDSLVDTLRIGSDLQGRAVTDIQISGSGTGLTEPDAIKDALKNMKKLQTVLITGSLPVQLEIVKIDTLSPALGDEFVENTLLVALFAILAVAVVVYIRYRKLQVSIPIAVTMISEIVIMLGIAAIIGWNLDIAAIAGILIAAGTGVDHQIVITDETLAGEGGAFSSWKQRLKKAFSIIIASYFTTVVAMIPLLFAGAGLLKGFALTTIIGITIGVFITRPAYAAASEILLDK
ncbi:hypothetical protein GOV08_00640 [Candidatus Woesearchaeota archaeon]|nr:hypothetical protein [Candidatus Woesearchaeota archaeon]